MIQFDGEHVDVVTSFKIAVANRPLRRDARIFKSLAQPEALREQAATRAPSQRRVAVAQREAFEQRVSEFHAMLCVHKMIAASIQMQEQQRREEELAQRRAARELERRSDLPRLDPAQDSRCHTRNSHRNAMAGCAGRDVNHRVETFTVGSFTERCPWGCRAIYMKSEWDRLAKPRADGTVSSGLIARCCKDSRTNTDYLRNANEMLSHPPPLIKVGAFFFSLMSTKSLLFRQF